MYIFVEDTTSGLYFWEQINNILFKGIFTVIGFRGNRDLKRYLINNENKLSSSLSILIVDKMTDENSTRRTYADIGRIVSVHPSIIMPEYGCLERELLTYKKLSLMVGDNSSKIYKLAMDILKNTDKFGVIPLSILDKHGTVGEKYKSQNSEHIYKGVIAEYTNNTLAEVSQGTLGYCWKSPCCSGKAEHRLKRDKCSLYEFRENIYKNKLQDIINNSEFNIVIKNIVLGISNYLQRSYSQSKYDNKYRALILSKYKEVGAILIIAKIKTEKARDTWSYFDIGRILESEGAI